MMFHILFTNPQTEHRNPGKAVCRAAAGNGQLTAETYQAKKERLRDADTPFLIQPSPAPAACSCYFLLLRTFMANIK